jgi:hypothetical protein
VGASLLAPRLHPLPVPAPLQGGSGLLRTGPNPTGSLLDWRFAGGAQ